MEIQNFVQKHISFTVYPTNLERQLDGEYIPLSSAMSSTKFLFYQKVSSTITGEFRVLSALNAARKFLPDN